MRRSEFLNRILGVTVASAIVPLEASNSRPTSAPGKELTRAIPASGEVIPAVGMGTYITFHAGVGAPAKLNALREVLREFHAAGGTVVDSSPMYGAAESVFGRLSGQLGINGDCFLATKVWTRGAAAGREQMRASLRKLGRQKIELMQIHNLLDWRAHLPALRRWREAGRFRYIGVTHYTPSAFDELERVLRRERFDFVQLPYSVATRAAEKRLLPFCQDQGVAVIANRPYEGGELFRAVRDRRLPDVARELECQSFGQLFLKFLLGHPGVTCVIPATSNPRHMRDNMGAGLGPIPDTKQRARIAQLIGHSS